MLTSTLRRRYVSVAICDPPHEFEFGVPLPRGLMIVEDLHARDVESWAVWNFHWAAHAGASVPFSSARIWSPGDSGDVVLRVTLAFSPRSVDSKSYCQKLWIGT